MTTSGSTDIGKKRVLLNVISEEEEKKSESLLASYANKKRRINTNSATASKVKSKQNVADEIYDEFECENNSQILETNKMKIKIIENDTQSQNMSNACLLTFDVEIHDWRNFDCNGKRLEVDPQSRITQIGWHIWDINGNILKSEIFLIKPNGFRIAAKSEKYSKSVFYLCLCFPKLILLLFRHRITQEMCKMNGEDIAYVLNKFVNDAVIVLSAENGKFGAHKLNYDCTIVSEELKRIMLLSMTDKKLLEMKPKYKSVLKAFLNKSQGIDTHDLLLLKQWNNEERKPIPSQLRWFYGRRYGPRLNIFHDFMCDAIRGKSHDAGVDAAMCGYIIFALKNKYNINLFSMNL